MQPLPTFTLCDGQQVKLGRISPAAQFDFGKFHVVVAPDGSRSIMPRLGAFIDIPKAAPPTSTNWRAKAGPALKQPLGNLTQGCCVISSKGHQVGIWTGNETGTPVVSSDTEALSEYHRLCGPFDQGCVITSVLDAMKTGGISVGGTRHKIDNYVSIDWTNKALVQAAIAIFGTGCVGINLPNAWTCTNCVWDVTNTRIVGGHDVPFIDYDENYVYISTWGGVVQVTWQAFLSRNWIEEAYVELSPDWYSNGNLAPNGVDVNGLRTAFAQIQAGQVPDVPAPPAPPTPTPTPIPPAPTPTPPVAGTFSKLEASIDPTTGAVTLRAI